MKVTVKKIAPSEARYESHEPSQQGGKQPGAMDKVKMYRPPVYGVFDEAGRQLATIRRERGSVRAFQDPGGWRVRVLGEGDFVGPVLFGSRHKDIKDITAKVQVWFDNVENLDEFYAMVANSFKVNLPSL